ncbi:MAG TPA: electron transfer flavoprotein subunit beta/FixA family protein [Deltaproteobacteria bacterium]|nr:electron transfer flavoprotein subunit beta/FixA family protein [Deltaproteobacteria bacterium]
MKILVCIKQVCDSSETLVHDTDPPWVRPSPATVFRMNRFDEFALEEALLIGERFPGTEIHALSVGPSRVCTTIRKALEMGASHGIHLCIEKELYLSGEDTASIIAGYARDKGYDLILTGIMSEDTMHCQVGQYLGALLVLPCITSVISEEISPDDARVVVEREIESGRRQAFLVKMPVVLTIQSGINRPRYPSLSNVLRARSQDLETCEAEHLGSPAFRQKIAAIRYPDAGKKGTFIQGDSRQKARELLSILHEKSLLSWR